MTPSLCFWRALLGWKCPGCGLGNALMHLPGGQWSEAWALHPLSFLLAAELVLACLLFAASPGRLRRLPWNRILSLHLGAFTLVRLL